jgi:hypothetical protein
MRIDFNNFSSITCCKIIISLIQDNNIWIYLAIFKNRRMLEGIEISLRGARAGKYLISTWQ